MPKNTVYGGASYDGFVDVSPDGIGQPEWVAVAELDDQDELPAADVASADEDADLPEEPEPIELVTPSPSPRGKHETES